MKPSFDTSKEPCVPVYGGGSSMELSLRDALVRAHEFQGIRHELPTVEFGLYRLLVVLMGDIFFVESGVPLNTQRLGELLARGRFEAARVDDYFAKYPRFDLFDEDRPFLQVGKMHEKEKPVAGLLHPVPSGTNVNHFHHATEDEFAVSAKSAFQLVAAYGLFAVSMKAGPNAQYPYSINGAAPPIYALIRGEDLFQTLCLNLCAFELSYARKDTALPDAPAWRWERSVGGVRSSSGYLESLTWMPRRVQLILGEGGKCSIDGSIHELLVHRMKFGVGDSTKDYSVKKSKPFPWIDPNVAYQRMDEGLNAVRMREERELWRDTSALALIQDGEQMFQRPRVVDQFVELSRDGLTGGESLSLNLYGFRTQDAKYCEWQYDTLMLPKPLVTNSVFGSEVQDWMSGAEKICNVLVGAMGYLHPKRYRQENEAANNPKSKRKFRRWEDQSFDKVRYENFRKKITYIERRYWESLRPVFDELLGELASLQETTLNQRQSLRDTWRKTLEKSARTGFDLAIKGLETKSQALERVTRARRLLEFGLKRVFDPPPPDGKMADKPGRKKGVKAE
ncbi:MAG: type I-E CRISPR-associated protein Cse1/CasA [Meiothermus sp.]|nr:type I-E CRISPR-associated protein Cse1/CasA [Meiothermus sp.]